MEISVGVTWTLCLLGFFIIGSTDAISCYECNSEYDPRCADPFDSYTIGVVNCSMKRPLEHLKHIPDANPVLCRKTTQKVQGKVRVIRGCGYLRDERDDKTCVRRSGTHEVLLFYCSCTSELCNTGHIPSLKGSSILGATILGIVISLYLA